MDFSETDNYSKELARRRRGWLYFLIGLPALLIAFIALLPTLLSLSPVRKIILSKVGTALAPAELSIDDWSFAWFGKQSLTSIAYRDPRLGLEVSIRGVRLNSLVALLPFGGVAADVLVDTPEVMLNPIAAQPATGSKSPVVVSALKASEPLRLPFEKFSANLAVRHARFVLASIDEPLISDLSIDVLLPSLAQNTALQLTGRLLDAQLKASANLPPLSRLLNERRPGALLNEAQLSLEAPWTQLSLTAAGSEVLLPSAELSFECALEEVLRRLRSLNLTIPQPEALSGMLGFSLKLTPDQGMQSVHAALSSRHIAATLGGKILRLSPKLDLRARIPNANPKGAVLDRLSLELPGVLAAGQGSLKGGSLQAAVDCDALFEVLRPLIGSLPLPEKLSLRLKGDIRPEGTSDFILEGRRGSTELLKAALHAAGFDPEALSLESGKVELTADIGELSRLLSFPPGVGPLKGRLLLNAAGGGASDKAQASAVFALRDTDFRFDGWHIREPSLLEGSFRTDWDGRHLTLSAIRGTLPLGELRGSAAYDTQMKELFRALQLTVDGRLLPGYPLKHWATPKPRVRPLPEVDGSLNLNATLRLADTGLLPNAFFRITGDRLWVRDTSAPNLPKEPLALELSGDIRPEGNSSVSLDSRRGTESLVTASLQAFGVNPREMCVQNGKVTLNANLTEITRFIPLPESVQSLKGQVLLSAAGAGSKNRASLSALLALREADVRLDGWTVREPSLLESSFKADWDGRRATLKEFKATLPLGTVGASAAYDTQAADLLQALTLSLTGHLQPGYPLKHWAVPRAGMHPLPEADGTVALLVNIRPSSEGRLPHADINLNGENLRVRSDAVPGLPRDPFALHLKSSLRPEGAADLLLEANRNGIALIQATAQVTGVDPQGWVIEDGKASLAADLGGLSTLVPLPPSVKKLQGRLRVNAACTGSARKATLNTVFDMCDADILLDGFRIREATLAEGAFRADWVSRRLQISNLKVTLPLGNLQGNALLDTRLQPLAKALTATLDVNLHPGYPLASWLLPKPGAQPLPTLDGTLKVSVAARPKDSGRLPSLTLTASTDALTLYGGSVSGKIPLAPLRLKAVAGDLDSGDFRLDSVDFSFPYAVVRAGGTFSSTSGNVAVSGNLTPDFGLLWSLDTFEKLRAKGICLSGRNTRPFAFELPVTRGMPTLLGEGRGHAEIAFDRITVPMFDIPNAVAAVTLEKGLAEVRADVAFNGGHVRLHSDIQVDSVPMKLRFAPGAKVVDGVRITQAMMDAVIDGTLPFLKGAAQPHGSFDLVAERFEMDLDSNPLATLDADLTFQTHRLSLIPGGPMKVLPVLQELIKKPKEYLADITRLHLLKTIAESEDENAVSAALDRLDIGQIRIGLPDQKMKMHFNRGRMAVDPFKFSFDGAVKALVCEGSANLLSRDLDYRLRLPLSDRFVEKYHPKHANAGELVIPVVGKIDAPKIDMKPLRETFRAIIRENVVSRASKKLHEKANDRLNKLFKKAGVESDSDNNGHNDAVETAEEALDSALRTLFGK